MFISLTLYFLGKHKWITKLFFNNTTKKVFYLQLWIFGLLLVLQDSWSLSLLVLETKWLSWMLRWQRVAECVWDCVTVYFCVSGIFGESMRYLHYCGPEVKYELVCRERSYARIDIAKFLGWHEVVPVEGMLNASNSYSTGIPCMKSIN